MSVLLLILGLVLFVSLVVVHEFGHFIVARRNGVTVEEFGIGFPPRAWSKQLKSGLLLTVNWLPLGGFVRLKGEHDADKSPGSYGRANLWAKTKIMLAGVAMNLLAAFVLLTVLAWVGMPQLVDNQYTINRDTKVLQNQVLISFIESGSPAEKAGLQLHDQIVGIGETGHQTQKVTDQAQLPKVTQSLAGRSVQVVIRRDGVTKTIRTTLRSSQVVAASKKTNDPKGYLGVSPTEYRLQRSTWSAPVVAIGLMVQITILTLQGLGHALGALFTGHAAQAGAQVTGPIGIFALLQTGSVLGYQFILMIVAIISLALAIMNALPIPALDGGRLFVTWLYRGLRRPLSQRTEEWIHGTGFMVLMVLVVLISIVDFRRYF